MKFDLYENDNFITRLTATNEKEALTQIKKCGLRLQSSMIQLKPYGGQ